MTHDEAKAAFMEECPVVYGGVTYQRISALIYRKNHTGRGLRVQAELKDNNNRRNESKGGQAMKRQYEFVAVDFDGTLCRDAFPDIGEPNPVVIGYVKKLAAEGSKIILYTSRENGTRPLLDEAVAFCKAQGIPLYAVNENPGNPYAARFGLKHSDGRKLYADLYIDDKALKVEFPERTNDE